MFKITKRLLVGALTALTLLGVATLGQSTDDSRHWGHSTTEESRHWG